MKYYHETKKKKIFMLPNKKKTKKMFLTSPKLKKASIVCFYIEGFIIPSEFSSSRWDSLVLPPWERKDARYYSLLYKKKLQKNSDKIKAYEKIHAFSVNMGYTIENYYEYWEYNFGWNFLNEL